MALAYERWCSVLHVSASFSPEMVTIARRQAPGLPLTALIWRAHLECVHTPACTSFTSRLVPLAEAEQAEVLQVPAVSVAVLVLRIVVPQHVARQAALESRAERVQLPLLPAEVPLAILRTGGTNVKPVALEKAVHVEGDAAFPNQAGATSARVRGADDVAQL